MGLRYDGVGGGGGEGEQGGGLDTHPPKVMLGGGQRDVCVGVERERL